MTEDEYLRVKNIVALGCALDALMKVMPSHNPWMSADDWAEMLSRLFRMRENMLAALKLEESK